MAKQGGKDKGYKLSGANIPMKNIFFVFGIFGLFIFLSGLVSAGNFPGGRPTASERR